MSYKLWALICVELLYLSLVHFQQIFRRTCRALLITILRVFSTVPYWPLISIPHSYIPCFSLPLHSLMNSTYF
jgi:hypothetical protein